MSIAIEQYIFWLNVSVDDVPGVEVFESQEQLSSVELGDILIEFAAAPEQVEQLSLPLTDGFTPGKKSTSRYSFRLF